MVVMQNKAGQLANRLFAFSHFIGNAVEYRYKLINPTFDEYGHLFPAVARNDFGGADISVHFRPRISFKAFESSTRRFLKRLPRSPWHRWYRLDGDDVEFDLRAPDFIESARSKLVFTTGWQFRDTASLFKHRPLIRACFTPAPDVVAKVEACRREALGGADMLVGVHIRRGDYAQWQQGRYLYELDDYARLMGSVAAGFRQEGRRVAFLLCSNENLAPAAFDGLPVHLAPGHPVKDLYALASCDAVMGPPSTYSLWAAYYGGAELCHIQDVQAPVTPSDFKRLGLA